MEHLAPAAGPLGSARLPPGAIVFTAVGAYLHTSLPFVTPSRPFSGVPGNFVFFRSRTSQSTTWARSAIASATPLIRASTRQMRTSPLWGARFNT
jgi:hypothetical protein